MTRVAASVAATKLAHPERYCPHPRCLWRTGGGRCPRHQWAMVPLVPLTDRDEEDAEHTAAVRDREDYA